VPVGIFGLVGAALPSDSSKHDVVPPNTREVGHRGTRNRSRCSASRGRPDVFRVSLPFANHVLLLSSAALLFGAGLGAACGPTERRTGITDPGTPTGGAGGQMGMAGAGGGGGTAGGTGGNAGSGSAAGSGGAAGRGGSGGTAGNGGSGGIAGSGGTAGTGGTGGNGGTAGSGGTAGTDGSGGTGGSACQSPAGSKAPSSRVVFVDRTSQAGLNASPVHSMVLADLNGDGFVDRAKTLSEADPIVIEINNRDGTFSVRLASITFRGLGWGDIDNDGDIDLVGRNGVILRNDGPAGFTHVTRDGNNSEAVVLLDVDLDGDLDVWEPGTSWLWYRNEGSFRALAELPGPAGIAVNGEGSSAADINNDGYLDIVFSDAIDRSVVFLGSATGNYSMVEDVSGMFGLPEHVSPSEDMEWAWGDYDSDGDLDLFISGATSVGLYENDGSGRFSNQTTPRGLVPPSVIHGADWGDYDNDGDLDLILAAGAETKLYENQGACGFYAFVDVTALAQVGAIGSTVGFVDHDNDGDLDIISGKGVLLDNVSPSSSGSLRVMVIGKGAGGAPKTPLGATVDVRVSGTVPRLAHRRLMTSFNNLQKPNHIHVGLDPSLRYDVTVRFPSSGVSKTVANVSPDEQTASIGGNTLMRTIVIGE